GNWSLHRNLQAPVTARGRAVYRGLMDGTTVDNLNVLDAVKTNDTNGVEIITWQDVVTLLTTSTNATQTVTIQQAFTNGQLTLTFAVGPKYFTIGCAGSSYFIEQTDQYGFDGQVDPYTGQSVAYAPKLTYTSLTSLINAANSTDFGFTSNSAL